MIVARQEELTEKQVREEADLIDEYVTNFTWRGEVCQQVQVGRVREVGRWEGDLVEVSSTFSLSYDRL